jgi:SAM-dependent methyltransferase
VEKEKGDMETANGKWALDRALETMEQGDVFEALESFAVRLTQLRRESQPSEWRGFCQDVVPAHPLWNVIHQAPFTRRAFEKPRGYPGDAVVLDWIYGFERLPIDAPSPLVELHRWEHQTPSCVSVRNRKAILASTIDAVAARRPRPIRVLAVACGHLREAAESAAFKSNGIAEFLALDHDAESLRVASTMGPAVTPVHGSVRSIIANKIRFTDLDLVYAAGLYDYLGPAIARQLTRALFDMLRPGGTLLIANFNPGLRDIGYLEAYMDWQLVYRADLELDDCANAIAASEIDQRRVFREPAGNITFLELERAT